MSGLLNMLVLGSAFLWTLLITALIGNVIANNVDAATSAKAAVNFSIFVAALSWIVIIFGIASTFISALARPIIQLPLYILAVVFTLVDAIVLAAKLGTPNCGNLDDDTYGHSWIAYGSNNNEKRCREIQASTVFMWFLFLSFCGTLFFAFTASRGSIGGSSRSSRPNMSQVGV